MQRIDEAIGLLYESAIDREFLNPSLDALMDEFSGCNASLWIRDRNTGHVLLYDSNNVSVEVRSRYAAVIDQDPWFIAAAERIHGPAVASGTQLVDQSRYRRSETYSEFMSKVDIEFMLAGGTLGSGSHEGAVVVNRSKRGGDFSAGEIAKFTALLPHVLRVIRLTVDQRLAAAVFRGLEVPWIEVGANGIEHINEGAAALLRRSGAIRIRNNQLQTKESQANERLADWIRNVTSGDYKIGPTTSMQITIADDGHPIQLILLPSTTVEHGVRIHRAVILLCEQAHHLYDFGFERFGFTPAETELVGALMTGERLAHYARRNGRSIHTVRSHLKSVLRKAAASSQADLLRRVLFGA